LVKADPVENERLAVVKFRHICVEFTYVYTCIYVCQILKKNLDIRVSIFKRKISTYMCQIEVKEE
jgi:hypothetical protein